MVFARACACGDLLAWLVAEAFRRAGSTILVCLIRECSDIAGVVGVWPRSLGGCTVASMSL